MTARMVTVVRKNKNVSFLLFGLKRPQTIEVTFLLKCRCPKTSFGKFERSEDALGGKQANLAI